MYMSGLYFLKNIQYKLHHAIAKFSGQILVIYFLTIPSFTVILLIFFVACLLLRHGGNIKREIHGLGGDVITLLHV